MFLSSCLIRVLAGYAALSIVGVGGLVSCTLQAELVLGFVWEGVGRIVAGEQSRLHVFFVPPA